MKPIHENKINELLSDQDIYQDLVLLMQKYGMNGLPTPESLDRGLKEFGGVFARELKLVLNPNANAGGEGDNTNVTTTDGNGGDNEDTSNWWDIILEIGQGGVDIYEDYKNGLNDNTQNQGGNNNNQGANAGIDQKTLLMIGGGFMVFMLVLVLLMKGGK